MRFWSLGSGSRGNALLVESGGCRLLVDAGFGPRTLKKRLHAAGIDPHSIEACLVTHEHSDHARGALRGAKKFGWDVYASSGTAGNSRLAALGPQLKQFRAGESLAFTEIEVSTFLTPHDAVEPVGVVMTSLRTGARIAICTDVGHASHVVRRMVKDVDMLVLESNHDDVMLANGPYPFWLQRRIASSVGHLSNRACASLARETVTSRLRQIVLAHVSEQNNTPQIAYECAKGALAKTSFRGKLTPALQDSVVGPFSAAGSGQQLALGL